MIVDNIKELWENNNIVKVDVLPDVAMAQSNIIYVLEESGYYNLYKYYLYDGIAFQQIVLKNTMETALQNIVLESGGASIKGHGTGDNLPLLSSTGSRGNPLIGSNDTQQIYLKSESPPMWNNYEIITRGDMFVIYPTVTVSANMNTGQARSNYPTGFSQGTTAIISILGKKSSTSSWTSQTDEITYGVILDNSDFRAMVYISSSQNTDRTFNLKIILMKES